MMQTQLLDRRQLVAELAEFVGTHQWHQHPFTREMTYTDGVKYFADRTGSYWLVDFVATELFSLLSVQPFLSIIVASDDVSCKVCVTDGNENQIVMRKFPFSTMPDGKWKFYLTDDVLILPSEY